MNLRQFHKCHLDISSSVGLRNPNSDTKVLCGGWRNENAIFLTETIYFNDDLNGKRNFKFLDWNRSQNAMKWHQIKWIFRGKLVQQITCDNMRWKTEWLKRQLMENEIWNATARKTRLIKTYKYNEIVSSWWTICEFGGDLAVCWLSSNDWSDWIFSFGCSTGWITSGWSVFDSVISVELEVGASMSSVVLSIEKWKYDEVV